MKSSMKVLRVLARARKPLTYAEVGNRVKNPGSIGFCIVDSLGRVNTWFLGRNNLIRAGLAQVNDGMYTITPAGLEALKAAR